MPTLAIFYGIVVYIYFKDNKRHHEPHIHVFYGEDEVVVAIPSGKILMGEIPRKKMKLLCSWMELHMDDLLANWHLAVTGGTPYAIEPLR